MSFDQLWLLPEYIFSNNCFRKSRRLKLEKHCEVLFKILTEDYIIHHRSLKLAKRMLFHNLSK